MAEDLQEKLNAVLEANGALWTARDALTSATAALASAQGSAAVSAAAATEAHGVLDERIADLKAALDELGT